MSLFTIIGWIIIGLVAGWLASSLMGRNNSSMVGDIVLGLVGALVGGFIATLIPGIGGINGSDPISWGSLIISLIGAVIVIAVSRLFTGKRASV